MHSESLARSPLGSDRETADAYIGRIERMRAVSEKLVQELTPEEVALRQHIGRGMLWAEIFANHANEAQ